LASLPSPNSTYYIAGESQNGNDFDLQFQNDNRLYFYTDAGTSISYAPNTASMVGQWHMIAATFNATTNTQDIYWDGSLVSSGNVGSGTNKTGAFWIGNSSVFSNRWFNGGIDEVAVWNYDLSAAQVSSIYASASSSTGTAPEPASWLLLGLGLPVMFWVRRRSTQKCGR